MYHTRSGPAPWPGGRLGEDLGDDLLRAPRVDPGVDPAAVLERDRAGEAGVAHDPQGPVGVVDEVVAGGVEPHGLGVDDPGEGGDARQGGVERLRVDAVRRGALSLLAG